MKETQAEASAPAFWECPRFWALTRLLWEVAVNCREEGEDPEKGKAVGRNGEAVS